MSSSFLQDAVIQTVITVKPMKVTQAFPLLCPGGNPRYCRSAFVRNRAGTQHALQVR